MNDRPNILFIIADDHRFDAIRAFGDPVVQTPTLDGLAERGVSFRRTYIMGGLTGAVCIPSRACLHTGVNIFDHAVSQQIDDGRGLRTLNPRLALLPETLRQAGYYTFASGKWHNDRQSFARCFAGGGKIFFGGMSDHYAVPVHDFDPAGLYPEAGKYKGDKFSTELFSEAAIQFIRSYRRAQPFFLYLAYTAPHDPRTAPQAYADLYDPAQIPLPENFLAEHPFDNGELAVRDEALAPWPRRPEVIRQHIAAYYAMISHMDAHIGRVLEALEESGQAEKTIVVYTADHGLAVGQHGLLGKQNLYEHSIRVPLILSGPGLPRHEQVEAIIYAYDLFPTLCELVGLPIPETVESQSLLPLIRGEKGAGRNSVYAAYKDVQRMVSDGAWKLIRYYRSASRAAGSERRQLFHLAEDPWERYDLASDPGQRERLQHLAAELAAWQRRVGDPYFSPHPPAPSPKPGRGGV